MVKVPNKLVELLNELGTATTDMLEESFIAHGMAASSVQPGLTYLMNLGIVARVNVGLWRLTPAASSWEPIT